MRIRDFPGGYGFWNPVGIGIRDFPGGYGFLRVCPDPARSDDLFNPEPGILIRTYSICRTLVGMYITTVTEHISVFFLE
jgi:hypothetical protein